MPLLFCFHCHPDTVQIQFTQTGATNYAAVAVLQSVLKIAVLLFFLDTVQEKLEMRKRKLEVNVSSWLCAAHEEGIRTTITGIVNQNALFLLIKVVVKYECELDRNINWMDKLSKKNPTKTTSNWFVVNCIGFCFLESALAASIFTLPHKIGDSLSSVFNKYRVAVSSLNTLTNVRSMKIIVFYFWLKFMIAYLNEEFMHPVANHSRSWEMNVPCLLHQLLPIQ